MKDRFSVTRACPFLVVSEVRGKTLSVLRRQLREPFIAVQVPNGVLKREAEIELSVTSDASWFFFFGSKHEMLTNNTFNSYVLPAKAGRNASFILTTCRNN